MKGSWSFFFLNISFTTVLKIQPKQRSRIRGDDMQVLGPGTLYVY